MSHSHASNPVAPPLDTLATTVVIALCLFWGLNQVAIKLTLPDFPPLIQATVRSFGALVVVVLWSAARRVPLLQRDGTLVPGVVAGVLFGLEFVLIYRGIHLSMASRASIFIYTAPFFVALGGAFFIPGERLGPWQWFGLALSFTGTAVAIGVPQAAVDARMLTGDVMLIGGGALWAATTLVIKGSRLRLVAPEKTLAYQVLVSVPILAVAAWALDERIVAAPRPAAVWWLAYQTVWIVGVTYGIWFALVKHYSASRLSAFTFLTPLFGIVGAHVMLGDPIEWPFALASALVVAGLVLVNRPR
ncbi:MAG: DMT family transporter [Xanthobacteraceae bacterium]